MTRPLCIYHGGCDDGFAAAFVIHLALKGEVDFHYGVYQQDPPDVTGRTRRLPRSEVVTRPSGLDEWMRANERSTRR